MKFKDYKRKIDRKKKNKRWMEKRNIQHLYFVILNLVYP